MKLNLNILTYYMLFLALTLSSCATIEVIKTPILLKNLTKGVIDSGECTAVTILKTYPSKEICVKGEIFANLYICKKVSTKDTVYVLDICHKVLSFAIDKNFKDNVCIMKYSIEKTVPQSVIIYIPKSFVIADRSPYILATLTALND